MNRFHLGAIYLGVLAVVAASSGAAMAYDGTAHRAANGVTVRVAIGDITRSSSRADYLVTAVNPGGIFYWNGGVDKAIRRVANDHYHQQASPSLRGAAELTTFIAKGRAGTTHNGRFDNVAFVVDDLHPDLHEVVRNGLQACESASQSTCKVVLPLIRSGLMADYGGGLPKIIAEHVKGINMFALSDGRKNVKEIEIYVYSPGDYVSLESMKTALDLERALTRVLGN